jgi:TonB family protein
MAGPSPFGIQFRLNFICSPKEGGSLNMIHSIQKPGPIICAFLLIAVASTYSAVGGIPKNATLSGPQISSADSPREALKKSAYADQNVKSYRVRIGSPGASPDAAVIIEYVLPDRWHVIEKNEEMIVVGNDAYRKAGTGPWRPFKAMLLVPHHSLGESINAIDKADEVDLIGPESIDGVPSLVYRRTSYLGPNKTIPLTTRLWIGEADSLLRKSEFDCDVESKKVTTVSTYYDYNADIKIERPEIAEGTRPDTGFVNGTIRIKPRVESPVGPGRGYNRNTSSDSPPDSSAGGAETSVDQKPELLNRPRPNYTEEARKNGIQGIVVVRVLVGADGAIKRVYIERGLPDGLNEEAIRAAYQLRFRPAMKDGKPVAFWHPVQIEFHL